MTKEMIRFSLWDHMFEANIELYSDGEFDLIDISVDFYDGPFPSCDKIYFFNAKRRSDIEAKLNWEVENTDWERDAMEDRQELRHNLRNDYE